MKNTWKLLSLAFIFSLLNGCAINPELEKPTYFSSNENKIVAAGDITTKPVIGFVTQETQPSVSVKEKKAEKQFNFVINNSSLRNVYMALVDGTSYSIVLPDLMLEQISINLKSVTAYEVLETLKKTYGYDYEVKGKTIFILPKGQNIKAFQINYPVSIRSGKSEVRVISGSVSDTTGGSSNANSTTNNTTTSQAMESSKISTSLEYNFWVEVEKMTKAFISEKGSITVSPMTNTLIVKGTNHEIQLVENYLKKIQAIIDRQVMIEAKIIEVKLSKNYESGINWAWFNSGSSSNFSVGNLNNNTALSNTGTIGSGKLVADVGSNLVNALEQNVFGLAFQATNFAALLKFLETHGDAQVLSSPRIATLNNQKAILKVGVDEFFVTNITNSTTTSSSGTTNAPSITVQPFFSGIALDITPQIGDNNMVSLHVHPSVSQVSTAVKEIDLGDAGNFTLPLASSSISETDSIVRLSDGHIAVIGGLMKQYRNNNREGVQGLSDTPIIGNLFTNKIGDAGKSELVILIKPKIIKTQNDWDAYTNEIKQSLMDFDKPENILVQEKK